MTFKSNPIGNEITCIMYGIDDAVLSDHKKIEQLLLESAAQENFNILDKKFYAFRPHGFTGILLLTESHIAIHTYPEYNSLVFNLYSCRGPEDGKRALEYFKTALKPSQIELRQNKVAITQDI